MFTYLEGKDGNMALIPLTKEKSKVIAGKHASQYVNATFDFSWIDYFDIEVVSTQPKTTIASIILPVDNKDEAKKLANSKSINIDAVGNLTISFLKKGVKYTYNFDSKNGMLTFKN